MLVRVALVLKLSVPPRLALPFTDRRLAEPPPTRILSVPELIVRLPIDRVPILEPSPGVIEPLFMVTAELVALPVPPKLPPPTVIAPLLLVPLSRRVPPLIEVVPG